MKIIRCKKQELLTYLMGFFILLTTLFGVVNIYKSSKIINKQAETNFLYLAENIKQTENIYFKIAEEETEHCRKIIELTINHQKLNKIAPYAFKYREEEIPYINKYLKRVISPMLSYSSKHINGLVSIYFCLDYNFFKHDQIIGSWFVDRKLNGKFELIDSGPVTDISKDNGADLSWFYEPRKLKRGVWSEPYMDRDLKIDMISYSTPVYSGEKIAGIMGVDISMDDIKDFIKGFKIYKTGRAYLLDGKNRIIYAKNHSPLTSAKEIDENLYNFIEGFLHVRKGEVVLPKDSIQLVKSSSSNKLFAVTGLDNGFVLVLEVPIKELYSETIKLIGFTSLLLVLSVLVLSLVLIEAHTHIKRVNNELMHKEKLMSMGIMAAEIAHEINNPVGFINCNLDTLKKFISKLKILLDFYNDAFNNIYMKKSQIEDEIENINNKKKELKADYLIETLDEIIDESKEGISRVSNIVMNLKGYSKDDVSISKTLESLENIIGESIIILGGKIKYDVEIVKKFESIPAISCYKNQLEQVFINLIDNACYSVLQKNSGVKKVVISIYKKGDCAYVEVEDNGIGIDKKSLEKIFQSFYTTKAQGEGTGLGLSIAQEIISKKHKGEISVESKKGMGTKFIIKIPYS